MTYERSQLRSGAVDETAPKKRKIEDEIPTDYLTDGTKRVLLDFLDKMPSDQQTEDITRFTEGLKDGTLQATKRHKDKPTPQGARAIHRFLHIEKDYNEVTITNEPENYPDDKLTITYVRTLNYARFILQINRHWGDLPEADCHLGAYAISCALKLAMQREYDFQNWAVSIGDLMRVRSKLRTLGVGKIQDHINFPRTLPFFRMLQTCKGIGGIGDIDVAECLAKTKKYYAEQGPEYWGH